MQKVLSPPLPGPGSQKAIRRLRFAVQRFAV
jgi:hypothetical protein